MGIGCRGGFARWAVAGLGVLCVLCVPGWERRASAEIDTVARLIAGMKLDQNNVMREKSAEMLAQSRDPRAVAVLIEALHDKDVMVRRSAVCSDLVLEAEAIEPLVGLLGDEDALVRTQAVRALRELREPDTAAMEKLLLATLKNSESGNARAGAVELLRGMEGKPVLDALKAALDDSDAKVSEEAAMGVGERGDARAAGPLVDALKQGNDTNAYSEGAVLRQVASPETVGLLLDALRGSSAKVRRNAVIALGKMDDTRVTAALIHAEGDVDHSVRAAAAAALGERRDPDGLEAVVTALRDPDRDVRDAAAEQLGNWKNPRAVQFLVVDARDFSANIRLVAMEVIARMPGVGSDPEMGPVLAEALSDPDRGVRKAAAKGLQRAALPEDPVETPDTPSVPARVSAVSLGRSMQGQDEAAQTVMEDVPDLLKELTDVDVSSVRKAARWLVRVDDARAKKALQAAWKSHDVTVIAGAARFYLNDAANDAELEQVLRQFGDAAMAEDLLNSGDTELVKASQGWADRHGYGYSGSEGGWMKLVPIPV